MSLEKKHYVIAAAIGITTVSVAGLAYLQYKRMMNYVIKIGKVKAKTITAKLISFDLFLNFTNKANIEIEVLKNTSKVYVNDRFVTKIESLKPFTIKAESTSQIGLNIEFNPVKVIDLIGAKISDILLNPSNISIRVDVRLNAKLWFFSIPIKDSYTFTLKEIMDMSKNAPSE